jgi:hypothetical protein
VLKYSTVLDYLTVWTLDHQPHLYIDGLHRYRPGPGLQSWTIYMAVTSK